jgi:tRNA(Ile)-lysidine synthase
MRPQVEGEADAGAVADLCRRLGVEFVRAQVRVRAAGGNAEATARRLRYRDLGRLAVAGGCGFIATGHQGDDQVETMLMRLVRGTGARGLAGIAPVRPLRVDGANKPDGSGGPGNVGEPTGAAGAVRVVRPLLALDREACEAVCRAAGIPWREDATNADASRWRARLRRDVLPVLKGLRGDLPRRAAATASLLREAGAIIERAGAEIFERAERRGAALWWRRDDLAGVGPAVLGEVIRRAHRQIAGDVGADQLRARGVESVARGLRDADRRPREWRFAGIRASVDRAGLSIGPAESPHD